MHPEIQPSLSDVLSGFETVSDRESSDRLEFAQSVQRGMCRTPRELDSRFLYDRRGSELFEAICDQPEYYLTRAEESILREQSTAIAGVTGPLTVLELGAGTSRKTLHLLTAYDGLDALRGYVTVDVSRSALDLGRDSVREAVPGADVYTLCAPYEASFPAIGRLDRTLVSFLGSTIGNFPPEAMNTFFATLAGHLKPGDFFLVGADLHKDSDVLEAAYNDAAGVTAAFTCNLFARMNRELGAGLDLDQVHHRAFYNRQARQIEIYGEFSAAQQLRIGPLNASHAVAAGERIRTEVSRKFVPSELGETLRPLGLVQREVFHDARSLFALMLFERATTSC